MKNVNPAFVVCIVFGLYRDFCQDDFTKMIAIAVDKYDKYKDWFEECTKSYYNMDSEKCLFECIVNGIAKEKGFVQNHNEARIAKINDNMKETMTNIWKIVQTMTDIDFNE